MAEHVKKSPVTIRLGFWDSVRPFLFVFFSAAMITALLVFGFYQFESRASKAVLVKAETSTVEMDRLVANQQFGSIASDLLLLTGMLEHDLPMFKNWEKASKHVSHDLWMYAAIKNIYDQIRFIDANGMERIRVNYNNGKPAIVSESRFQNKAHRYYFRDAMNLERGDIYVSPFDLNVEHGQVEQPWKPMIRFATPVFNDHGDKMGITVLNFLGAKLLGKFELKHAGSPGDVMLLNADGYWMHAPWPEKQWGFMFPGGEGKIFGKDFPEEWQRIREGKSGQFETANGLFTYATVYPMQEVWKSSAGPGEALMSRELQPESDVYHWKIVSHVSARALAEYPRGLTERSLKLYLLLLIPLGIGSWFLARHKLLRAMSEKHLKKSEERLRLALGTANEAWFDVNVQTGAVQVSPEYAGMIGYDPEEFDTSLQGWMDHLHPDDRESVTDAFSTCLATGGPEAMEYRRQTKSGGWAWIYSVGKIVEWDAEQKPLRMIGIHMGISDRKEAEQRIIENDKRYRSFVEGAKDAVFIADAASGLILETNDAASQLIGLPKEKIIGMHQSELHPADKAEFYKEIFERHARDGSDNESDVYICRSDGRLVPVEISTSVVELNGRKIMQGMFRDISERTRDEDYREALLEDLKAKNKELERFAYSVSHDLKTPMITIRGFLNRLEQDVSENNIEYIHDDIGRITKATKKMHKMLEDVLELSRIGRLVNPPEEISLSELALEAAAAFDEQIVQDGVQLDVDTDLPSVSADRPRLLQVYQNLIGNALGYMGERKKPHIEMGAEKRDGELAFFVRDNGIGIEPPFHEEIFGLFEQLDPKAKGTGVGLALCRRIIEAHDGRIWVESGGKGKGSTFYFTLKSSPEKS